MAQWRIDQPQTLDEVLSLPRHACDVGDLHRQRNLGTGGDEDVSRLQPLATDLDRVGGHQPRGRLSRTSPMWSCRVSG